MRTLRILLSIHHALDTDSGAPGATLALGDALADRGHRVSYLSFDDLPGTPPPLVSSLAFPYFAAARFAIEARRGLDVIDASTGDAWLWSRVGRRRPLLVTRSHGLEHLFHEQIVERARAEGEPLSRRYPLYWGGWRLHEVRMSLRGSDLVLVLNEREREFVVERLRVRPERVRLTANGLPASFLAAVRAARENAGGPSIAVVGAWRPMKGVEHGSAALATAMAADAELRVSLLGTGVPAETVLARFPPELRDRIAATERYSRGDLPQLLAGHSIVLFPSFSEGFSLAMLEAMACGLAPVASDIPGVRQIVEDGRNGLLVPPGDAEAAAAALLRLRADAPLLGRLRAAARQTGLAYSWQRVAEQTSDLYEEALDLRAGSGRAASGRAR
jgi:glycosyltransferase involved in cell wall biosynthesis